jgi:hypothetical protein
MWLVIDSVLLNFYLGGLVDVLSGNLFFMEGVVIVWGIGE